MAAQSIGEPGTLINNAYIHDGGVAGGADIIRLPRIQKLFEARNQKQISNGEIKKEEELLLILLITLEEMKSLY